MSLLYMDKIYSAKQWTVVQIYEVSSLADLTWAYHKFAAKHTRKSVESKNKCYKLIQNKTGCDSLLPSFLPSFLLSFHFIFCSDQAIHTDAAGFFLIVLHIQNCLYEQLRPSLDQVS